MFSNRAEGGKLLASRLEKYRNTHAVVMAVPRGGVPVASEIAKALQLPLDLVFVKKIGHPLNKELAIGAVGLFESLIEPGSDVSPLYIQQEILAMRQRLAHMRTKFMGCRKPVDIRDRPVIVVDDGIATGNTLLATVKMLQKQHPLRIIIAVPVASRSSLKQLEPFVDEVITVLTPERFSSVGLFYKDFTQVSDEQVASLMRIIGHDDLVHSD